MSLLLVACGGGDDDRAPTAQNESTARPESFNLGSQPKLANLRAPAVIIRDTDGVPHLKASNAHDLFFLQGYVHANDRLFQMDVTRRRVAGTLAELLGSSALSSDAGWS